MSTSRFPPLFDGGHVSEQLPGKRNRDRKSIMRRTPDSAQQHAMIAEAAYFRAEHRGFEPGHELDDWLQAEAELTTLRA